MPPCHEIVFNDADFELQPVMGIGGRIIGWRPIGMPRLAPWMPKMVFFAFGINPKTAETKPIGSGVFVAIPSDLFVDVTHVYAVTCHHVAIDTHAIRVNSAEEGKSRPIDIEPSDWEKSDSGDDLAAADVTDLLSLQEDSVSALVPEMLGTKRFIEGVELGIGEDGFMLGLFADLPGKTHNLVAAKFGNISLLADDKEPIRQGNGVRRPSHLFDMRSRPGFSGSPVFVYRTPEGDIRDIAFGIHEDPPPISGLLSRWHEDMYASEQYYKRQQKLHNNAFIKLLGVHSAQFHDPVKIIEVEKLVSAEGADVAIKEGDKLKIHNSVAVTVPAWEIWPLINKPVFKEKRRRREEAAEKDRASRNDPEPESNAFGESGDEKNPRHREDFNSLLGAAAQKREREG